MHAFTLDRMIEVFDQSDSIKKAQMLTEFDNEVGRNREIMSDCYRIYTQLSKRATYMNIDMLGMKFYDLPDKLEDESACCDCYCDRGLF